MCCHDQCGMWHTGGPAGSQRGQLTCARPTTFCAMARSRSRPSNERANVRHPCGAKRAGSPTRVCAPRLPMLCALPTVTYTQHWRTDSSRLRHTADRRLSRARCGAAPLALDRPGQRGTARCPGVGTSGVDLPSGARFHFCLLRCQTLRDNCLLILSGSALLHHLSRPEDLPRGVFRMAVVLRGNEIAVGISMGSWCRRCVKAKRYGLLTSEPFGG